jgi:hypothetical protein
LLAAGEADLPGLIRAYNDAVVHIFLVCVAVSAAGVIVAAFVEWKSVKGKNLAAAGAA